jgi:hypothetical protein
LGLVYSCATNPLTGKKSLNFVSNSELFPTSFQQYGTFLKGETKWFLVLQMLKSRNSWVTIKAAAGKYLTIGTNTIFE